MKIQSTCCKDSLLKTIVLTIELIDVLGASRYQFIAKKIITSKEGRTGVVVHITNGETKPMQSKVGEKPAKIIIPLSPKDISTNKFDVYLWNDNVKSSLNENKVQERFKKCLNSEETCDFTIKSNRKGGFDHEPRGGHDGGVVDIVECP